MLPPAARHLIDRLLIPLMTLVHALAPGGAPSLAASRLTPHHPAVETLFFHLLHLVTHLIRISHFGVRPPRKFEPAPNPCNSPAPNAPPTQSSGPGAASRFTRHPGWLLDALPEVAPPVALEIAALLADPAIATLLDLDASLHRALRPLLCGLGLQIPIPIPAPPDPPTTEPPSAPLDPAPPLAQTTHPDRATVSRTAQIQPAPSARAFHYDIVTCSSAPEITLGAPHQIR